MNNLQWKAEKFFNELIQSQGGGTYQDMLDEVLANPELASFLRHASDTEFQIEEGFFNPNTNPVNGDKSVAGSAVVQLPFAVFNDKDLLFVIVGHELIHASHFQSGSYARWLREYNYGPDGIAYAHHISEAYAYKWSIVQANKYGLEMLSGGVAKYNYHLSMLPKGFNFPR